MDVIADGLLINQQKLDLENGSEDLQLLGFISYAFGGTIFTLMAGVTMTVTDNATVVWILSALLGLICMISAIRLNVDIEKSNSKVLDMGLCERVKFNWREVCDGFKIRGVTRLLLYLVLAGSIVPNYDEFLYQYMVSE